MCRAHCHLPLRDPLSVAERFLVDHRKNGFRSVGQDALRPVLHPMRKVGLAMSATGETTDYERIGGGPAVSAVVGRFYDAVLADPAGAVFSVSTAPNLG